MSKYREGSLEAPVRHPLNWQDKDFYNEQSLNQELERVFDICHGCRRCVSLCKSFPTLFDLVDESETFEVDSVDRADYKKVVDQCYLCDLCYMTKCPYVPPHEWNIDFPHLMLRAKAIQFKKGETKKSHKVLTSPKQVGSVASKPVISSIVNWSNSNKTIRKITENIMGVHVDAVVPKYHSKTLTKLFVEDKTVSKFKVAIFGTCYGEYNDPKSVIDLVDVLRHNNVEVKLIKNTQCCGMPKMELGDLETVIKYANENITPEDRYLENNENPPKVKIKFFEDLINIKNINCYSNEGNIWRKSDIKFLNENELLILLKDKFKSERGRINCSLWVENGKWRWLGIQYVIAEY